jgi:hypothetical protein
MINRPHGKKMGIIILVLLIVVSLAEVIFRSITMGLKSMTTSNFGEQLAIIALSVFLIVMTLKGKDRICYICYGAWLGCFVLNQLFGLPGMIVNMLVNISNPGIISIIIRVISMICIFTIGALVVEYMNDGTIYNRAFNVSCIIAVILLVADISVGIYSIAFNEPTVLPNGIDLAFFKNQIALDIFNKVYYVIMIFMFTFFAYDSAKMELAKLKK